MKESGKRGRIDWIITIVPLVLIASLGILFFLFPERSNAVLGRVRFFFGDTVGAFYIVMGLGVLLVSLYMCFSKYGDIILGDLGEKPRYSFFAWGSMMFTCGLAADILFYSFSEWIMYAKNPHISELGNIQDWAPVFPLFHWSFIPWAFYLVLAVCFGFMLHVRKRPRQRFSEACRPILGRYADGVLGRVVDLVAVFALLAGTATTFSVATPLMASIIQSLFGLVLGRRVITIIIILLTCAVYTFSLLHGFKGISFLANTCIYLFFGLMLFVLVFGGQTRFTIETGIESFGRMIQNFIGMSTYLDPVRTTDFAQDWTIYYWAYWMVWCVAAPFFIGSISRGRTVKQTILGGYAFGVGSTIICFVVFGNYSLGLQVSGISDFISEYFSSGDIYAIIISIIETIPWSKITLVWVLATMVAFYATSFDSIAYTASCYSYRNLDAEEQPNRFVQLLWCILLIVLPTALVFSDSSMSNIQTVSIIAAFPIGIIMFLIIWSFFKDADSYLNNA